MKYLFAMIPGGIGVLVIVLTLGHTPVQFTKLNVLGGLAGLMLIVVGLIIVIVEE